MEHVQALVKTREDKTSRMIFVLFITYCVCVLPITVLSVSDPENNYRYLSLVFYCVYWMQYCCNNVIYVMSNSVYRQAYIIFLTEMCPPLRRFLHQPPSWQPRRSTVTTIAGGHTQSTRSVAEAARRLRHADSLVSQTCVSGDSVSRDGLPSSPSSQPTASSDSPGSVASCRQAGGVARRVGPRRARPPPRRSISLEHCDEEEEEETMPTRRSRQPLAARLRRRLAGRRRSLPLERKAGPLPVWWALDDSSWLWYYCDNIAATVSRRVTTGSERRPRRDKRALFSRKRSLSF